MDFIQFKSEYRLRLDPQQELAVQSVDGPVLLLAVPGSGKTTVLVSRVGYMRHVCKIPASQILIMTYTVAAARDMRQRYAQLFGQREAEELEFRTINGICARIIRIYERSLGRTAFRLLDDNGQKSALLSDLCREQTKEFATESLLKAIETAITYVKNQMLSDEELESVEVDGVDFPKLYRSYCRELRRRQLMDYDDQMVYALRILRRYPQILNELQRRYHYFCVDEAQDTSRIQHCVIRLLASFGHNLFMVGDEDQSIYGFRAAYPQALTEFDQVYPDAQVLLMEQNYRSTEQIVAAADRFIQANQNRHPKHIRATRGGGPQVKQLQVYDRIRQYRYLAKLAADCTTETAVLYRDNDSALPLIDLLDREGVPYRCRQVDSVFFSSRIVRDVTDIIRFAQDPDDGERFMNIYYKFGARISKEAALDAVKNAGIAGVAILEYLSGVNEVSSWTRRQCQSLSTHLAAILEEQADRAIFRIVHYMGYGEYLENRGMDSGRIELLQALGVDQPTPLALLDRLEVLRDVVLAGASGSSDCPFILSTIHSSKGLEYERVILADVVDGVFPREVPGSRASEEELLSWEEERRLFYVGMTRAKEELQVVTFKKDGLHSTFAEELFPRKSVTVPIKGKPTEKVTAPVLAAMTRGYVPRAPVVHQSFGRGAVESRSGDYVTIRFDDGDTRKFSLTAAIGKGLLWLE